MSVLSLGSNIASLTAQRKLGETSSELSGIYERLSSGQRINKASDDAAGLAVLTQLSSERRVYTQGIRNFNDGVSLLNVADSSLDQLTSIATRLKELAEQATNGSYGVSQRRALDAEAQALSKEYFRIERSTTFNGRGLFFAEFGQLQLQGGYGTSGSISSNLGGAIGTATFQGATSYQAETLQSADVALGDLNGDGILDMATVGISASQDGFVIVRLGQGGGVFGTPVSTQISDQAGTAIEMGDFNNDGVLDLGMTARHGSDDGFVHVMLGTGSGTFGPTMSWQINDHITADVTLGDINGDGNLDFLAAGHSSAYDGYVYVLLGTGTGTLGAVTSYAAETTLTRSVAVGDLNGDNILDLVSSGYNAPSDGYITVRLGTGSGLFSSSSTQYAMDTRMSEHMMLYDLNSDGILDVVTAGRADGNTATAHVRLGIGDGTFDAGVSYVYDAATASFTTLDLADFNGDGFVDLLTGGYTDANTGFLNVRLGAANGTFQASAISYSGEGGVSYGVRAGDLNNDGVPDIVSTGQNAFFTNGSTSTRLQSTTSGVSPLLPFKLTSRAEALQALTQFGQTLDRLSAQRGTIGAFQSRLNAGVNNLQSITENYAAAESRIRDTDIAQDAALLVSRKILQQAATAVLAQANEQPALALRLLETK